MKFLPIVSGGVACLIILVLACGNEDFENQLPSVVDFNYHIKPLLSDRCFACHGPDEKAREAKLSLHTKDGLFTALEGDSARFIVSPGHLEASEIFHRIHSDDPEYMMPPPASNLSLSEFDKALITKWIKQGASWKKHWAFITPERPAIPKVKIKAWQKEPIDAFVLEKMMVHDLDPAAEENPERWLRRVYFDITGLSPTAEAIDSILQKHAEQDYERVVDRLLASPAFGERMTSIWLDLARYADSHGYQDDKPRSIWPWRDWVIEAFNANMPYDEFVTNQLAGDLIPDATYQQKLASAFNRNHAITQEGGVINEEYLTEYAADRVQTFATSFLGITLQCARCHDHKYDPLSQEEYFQLFGFFNNVEGERGQISYFDLAPSPSIAMEDVAYENYIDSIKNRISTLEDEMEKLPATQREHFETWTHQNHDYQKVDVNQGLVAHYELNDTSWNFTDQVTQSSDARPNVNLPPAIEKPQRVEGLEGQALKFNGENFLSIGDVGDFDHYQSFSISVWIKLQNQAAQDLCILGRRVDEQYRQGYDLTLLKTRQLSFRLIHNLNSEELEIQSSAKVPQHGWHHLAVTYDGSGQAKGAQIFIDGIRQKVNIIKDNLQGLEILNGIDFTIGHWNQRARVVNDQGGFANGSIDQVRIYDIPLSTLQINRLSSQYISTNKHFSKSELLDHYLLRHSLAYRTTKHTLDSLRALDISIPNIMIMKERDTVEQTYVLDRGMYDAKLYPVSRATPVSILPFQEGEVNRLGLAHWLFNIDNPLTARVAVNRIWQQFFGNGLVKSAEDFGNQGDLPSHPELLDYLAVQFRERGWDVKTLIKQIVLSKTYRQSAVVTEQKLKKDVSNKWLARGPHRPLSAEMSRDHALAVSGLLYEKIGGKWVKPYQPAGIWKELANQIGENKYRLSQGQNKYRRSLYTYWKRTIPPPTMLTLDAPERSVCTIKRQATSTPLQALILLNDPTYLEASRHLADKLIEQYGMSVGNRNLLDQAFVRIVSRRAGETELDELENFLIEMNSYYLNNPKEVTELLNIGDSAKSEFEDNPFGAAFALTISTLFNLDEARHR